MKLYLKHTWFFITVCLLSGSALHAQQSYFIEAEDFNFKGGWMAEKPIGGVNISNNNILRVLGGKVKAADAMAVIDVKAAGNYTVWVRAADYPTNNPGTRLFRVAVNEQAMEESGKHGKDGYYWEKAGFAKMETGENVIRLQDSRGNFGRCDAVLLTTETFNPNERPLAGLQKYKTVQVAVKSNPVNIPVPVTPAKIKNDAPVLAAISNKYLRLQFLQAEQRIASRTDIQRNGKWTSINADNEENRILLISSDAPQIGFGNFFPSWNGSIGFSSFTSKGKSYTILEPDNLKNPFLAGKLTAFIPAAVKKINDHTLEVSYRAEDGQTIQGIWELATHHLTLTLQYTPKQTAYYSLAVAAFQGVTKEKVAQIQLPPMFQYQRIPEQPVMLPSALMPQPLAMMEIKSEQGMLTTFITRAATDYPLDWAVSNRSKIGFSIKNERNEVQPVALSPVLGLDDSKITAAQPLKRTFIMGAVTANWNDALEYISDSIFKVKDYRSQHNTSLTNTAFNIIDLIKDDNAGGWDVNLKGFYDIEAEPKGAPTVVQSAPLAVISAAILGRDEDMYIKRALPAIEYTLSRSGFRSSKKSVLSPYNSQFTTAYYEGLNQLLNEANPWLKKVALPDNKIRATLGYSVVVPGFSQDLAAYRLTKDNKWLQSAKEKAAIFLRDEVYGTKTAPLTKQPFYNTSFYANWWDLTDLYDITHDTTYLNAAATAAFQTLIGVRAYPAVEDQLQTIHAGNTYEGNTTLWWKGGEKYRLGFPRQPNDVQEKKVPQALVSPVGLGFEQPYTFFNPGTPVRHVFMSSWAPHLLRLFDLDKRKIFETYARNAVIGRFTNYPGYYATGFTDVPMLPDFPYKGPDVSSIYYHHIPPHLAFTLDFLITEAMQRSNGKVLFPYGKQDGFVWFNNRIFGGGKGTILDDKNVSLWMKKGLVQIDKPEVNYITGISEDRFWIILLNEAHQELSCKIDLGKEAPVKDHTSATFYAQPDAAPATAKMEGREMNIKLPATGFAALSFPLAAKQPAQKITPVKDGMQVIDLGATLGKFYAFRIRSPFGWDSIYGFLENNPGPGTVVTVLINNLEEIKNTAPYEWSHHPLTPKEKAEVKVHVKTPDGSVREGVLNL
ncbi:hypothetical protein GFS24_27445 [Chitinophaga sp. SYP-B3965]|uniref:hypothetical protein n=1 Tax=Chitinophaga sp. SYP-B3965 TaxID=2663120 RepID=UPI0012997731|nr:hypothetical protein [Chitinophaga sp. SYP-B3965]MRG48876.1 hypothetical protein [Chitinophaga sp. SYP-B3965]